MRSMTGYGRSQVRKDGRELTVELKAVNHRYLDIAFHTPKGLSFIEDVLRERVKKSDIRRGHIEVTVLYQNTRQDACEVVINEAVLNAFNKAIASSWEQVEPYRRMHTADALTLSGALTVAQASEDAEAVTALAELAFDGALKAMLQMREREGQLLSEDLLSNLERLEELRGQIAQKAPSVPEAYRERLLARLAEWQMTGVDEQRVAQEVAIQADRCAIDEELSRLGSHTSQFRQTVENDYETGKKLDFLLQEMNREVNTIGSKACDAEIARCVVEAKCVVEKLREQVQNAV